MGQSWIDINNQAQEVWAKQYLLKKRAGMTRSNAGLSASNGWNESEPALRFLLRLEGNASCEASSILLKKMELSWVQQKNKHRVKKTQPVNISVQSSNQLKRLAASLGMTKVKTMEALISTQVDTQKQIIAQQKKSHEQRKQQLEQSKIALNAAKAEKHLLEIELQDLKTAREGLLCQLQEQKKKIKALEVKNRKIADLFPDY